MIKSEIESVRFQWVAMKSGEENCGAIIREGKLISRKSSGIFFMMYSCRVDCKFEASGAD